MSTTTRLGPGERQDSIRKPGLLHMAALLVGALAAFAALTRLPAAEERDFEELALGELTVPRYATVGEWPIHCRQPSDAGGCLDGHAERGARPVVLWLGNSQIHAINQLEPGDRTAPEILHHKLDDVGLDVLAFSLPNANPQELLLVFGWLSDRLPIRYLVVPLVFDDFRETGLRGSLTDGVRDPAVSRTLGSSAIGRTMLANYEQQAAGGQPALEGTVQEHTESLLNSWLEARWSLWGAREIARGYLFHALHQLRNRAFGITAQSKRRAIPGRLSRNLEATAAIQSAARNRGIASITYIAPLRDDVETPYVRAEYEDFKLEAARVSKSNGSRFADLDELVPPEHWGQRGPKKLRTEFELDFMHFQAPGHELLAEAVRDRIREPLSDP